MELMVFELKDKEFKYISSKVYDFAKINLTEKKRSLIVSRLSKRIRALNLNGFTDYIKYLEEEDFNKKEFNTMVDSLSTNFSIFFRELHHFEYLTSNVLPSFINKELKIWSAASSTGQEIYSILMTIKEFQEKTGSRINYKLYASDISSKVLIQASSGLFESRDIDKVDKRILKKYFLKSTGKNKDSVKIKKELIKDIKFFKLNLMDKSYKLPLMDMIFLRNAIIYFDKQTKTELVDRLYNYLNPGGYLILGHSESLSGISNKFGLIGKTIYRKENT